MNLLVKESNIHRSVRRFGANILHYSGQVSPRFEMECIHDLRTSVKKLRALLRWAGKGQDKKLTGGSKCLYSIAGEIRNTQVLFGHLDERGIRPAGLVAWMGLHLALLEGRWLYIYRPSTLKRLLKKVKRSRFKEVDEAELDEWLTEKQGEVRMLLIDPTLPDEQLHEVRKIYKDMQYVLEWHDKREASGDRRKRLEVIKKIGALAGDFNDRRIGLSLLYAYREEWHADSDEEAGKIIQDWEQDKKEKRAALLALLDEDIHARS